ncbi:LOW QUALITY PROTEIN: hypothetical protein CFOL_v3_34577, partial [Cephalotus follicularis]
GGDNGLIDIERTTVILDAEKTSGGGLYFPGKDRLTYRPPERKSLLGLDIRAIEKREGSKSDGGFKVPRDRIISVAASVNEEERFESLVTDELEGDAINGVSHHAGRKYRGTARSEASLAESSVTQEGRGSDKAHRSSDYKSSNVTSSSGSSRSVWSRSPRHERDEYDSDRSYLKNDTRSESRRVRRSYSGDHKEHYHGGEAHGRYEPDYSRDYGRKRSRYEDSRWTPRKSDWDDGRWEWQETPRRDSHSNSSRHHQPPSPMLVGASPDARLPSPWLGGRTPYSTGML